MIQFLLDNIRSWLIDNKLYWTMRLFDEVQFRALAAAGLSFLIVVLLGPRVIAWLRRMKIGDAGQTDAEALRAHAASRANTPTMGGILIVGAMFVSTLLLADLSRFHIQIGLVVLIWMAFVGGVDDWLKLTAQQRGAGSRQGLFAWEKLVFQLGIGLLAGFFVYRHGDLPETATDIAHVLTLPFQKTYTSATEGFIAPGLIYLPAWAFIGLAILMIAGMSNAVNITDGMDGLATGISAAVSLALLILTLAAGSPAITQFLLIPHIPFADELGVLAGSMLGACLGFLWWNCSPAHVFMGDTGSLALGGTIGYIAIVVRQELIILIACGVFLIEIASVILQVGYFKMTGGKRIFRCAPFHHHLHLGGWAEQQIVIRFWIISLLLVGLGLMTLKLR